MFSISLGCYMETISIGSMWRAALTSRHGAGTWDITVQVTDPNGGTAWQAVTRMFFSSPECRKLRTATGNELPVLVDPDIRGRIIVDVARLS